MCSFPLKRNTFGCSKSLKIRSFSFSQRGGQRFDPAQVHQSNQTYRPEDLGPIDGDEAGALSAIALAYVLKSLMNDSARLSGCGGRRLYGWRRFAACREGSWSSAARSGAWG